MSLPVQVVLKVAASVGVVALVVWACVGRKTRGRVDERHL